MNEPPEEGAAFTSSIGLAFVGGYADAASFVIARTFSGHLTGNSVLAAVSAASHDWYLTFDRLLAVLVFLGGVLLSLILNRFVSARLRSSSLAIAMSTEVVLFLLAYVLLVTRANQELFIGCMCLSLGIQNGALTKTKGISVHSTYMTGLVTTLTQKSFAYLSSERPPKPDLSKGSAPLTIRVLGPMWVSFLGGALAGAIMVTSFHSIGLLGIVLPLLALIFFEIRKILR
jgi:uncharacterized membrane protein YoaK (UPF0700 family)